MKVLHDGKAIIVGLEEFNLDDYPDLKVIGCNMTSTEHLPWEEINRRGINVLSLQGETEFLKGITSTAEMTIALILCLARNLKNAIHAPYGPREVYKGHTLKGKTLGIIGYGRVGKQVDWMARAFEMNIITADKGDDLTDLLTISDVVSIHIPLLGNEGFFTKTMFQMMKPNSYLINTSRLGIVEKGALLWALHHDIIKGAATDFIDDPELLEYSRYNTRGDKLILTNHQGGNTFEDRVRTEEFIINKVEEFLNEKN